MSTNGRVPILRRRDVSRASLRREPLVAEGNTVLVYVDRRGRRFVADRQLTASEIWFDTPRVVYVVDTAIHHESFMLELPSREEAFSFRAQVDLSWQVRNADAAVEAGIGDAESVYRPFLQQQMRSISRRFGVEMSADAEHEINIHFGGGPRELPQGLGLLSCVVALALDSATQTHIANRTLADRELETRERDHTRKIKETHRTEAEGEAEHRIVQLQAKQRQQLESLEEEHRISLQKMRMEFYDDALKDERFGLIKLRLEQNRDDIDGVIDLVMRQQQVDYDGAREFLRAAMDGGVVNPKHVAVAVTQAAEALTQGMRTHTGRPESRGEIAPPQAASGPQDKTPSPVIDVEFDEPGDRERDTQDDLPV
ncbi:hypothetical protein ACFYYH_20160 [Streptomyces sp. NPDC002018]|uniref:hypothetical protein n=1 Tax=Streptomyces sp. NPDC002018 TaxID=3364629 RepID=UPI00368F9B27